MTLQLSCITTIVENFERYYSKFSNSDDISLKRGFEFLQRKYSYEMASSLCAEGYMKEEYIDFFFNKYLKVLDFDWLMDSSWSTIIAKFQAFGPGLQKVYFRDEYGGKPLQDLMCNLPNLEAMTYHYYCTNEIIINLAKFCRNIQEIDILSSELVTNDGIKQLCLKEKGGKSCIKLRKLVINGSNVTDEGVAYLIKNLPSIEILDYLDLQDVLYYIHKEDLSVIKNIKPYNLQKLNITHKCIFLPHFTDLLKVCVSVCPHLKLMSCPIQEKEHLKILSELPALEKLHLENCSISEIDINEMLELNGNKLISLSVSSVSLSVFTLSKSCPFLKSLHLSEVVFKTDCESLLVLPCMETCIFDLIVDCKESLKAISLLLKSSSKLDSIAFKRCNISSSEMKVEILKCCEQRPIKKINLSNSEVELGFVEDILLNCPTLRSITLDDCGLDDESEAQLERIAHFLPNNPNINFSDHISLGSNEYLHDIYDFEGNFDDYDEYSDYGNYDDDDDDDFDDVYYGYDDDSYNIIF